LKIAIATTYCLAVSIVTDVIINDMPHTQFREYSLNIY